MVKKLTIQEKRKRIFVDLSLHCIFAAVLALLFRKFTGNWSWSAIAVVGGILIDLDHLVDYFCYYGVKWDLKDFIEHNYTASGKVYVLLHSWEIVFLIGLLGVFLRSFIPLAVGMAAHLIVDQFLSHKNEPFFYFLTYRASKKFDLNKLSPEWSLEK